MEEVSTAFHIQRKPPFIKLDYSRVEFYTYFMNNPILYFDD
jgi:hypothetical protein